MPSRKGVPAFPQVFGLLALTLLTAVACEKGTGGGASNPPASGAPANLRFAVSIDSGASTTPLDGRVLVLIAADETGRASRFTSDPIGVGFNAKMPEPRYLLNDFDKGFAMYIRDNYEKKFPHLFDELFSTGS